MKELIKGYKEFKNSSDLNNKELFDDLVDNGQHPSTFFVTCSDSRVVPNLITHSKPGDLFVARNIGNFIPPFSKDAEYPSIGSALEYAVTALEVEHIVICAHSECGAIGTLFKDVKPSDANINIRKWLTLGAPAKEKALKDKPNADLKELRDYTEKTSAVFQLDNLMTYPFVKERVEAGKLTLHAWHYNIRTGEILAFNKESNSFEELNG